MLRQRTGCIQNVQSYRQHIKLVQSSYLAAMLIHEAFNINTYSTCTFVKNSKLWLVVEKSSHLTKQVFQCTLEHEIEPDYITKELKLNNSTRYSWKHEQKAKGMRNHDTTSGQWLTAILCFSPPLSTSIQSCTTSQPPSRSSMYDNWTCNTNQTVQFSKITSTKLQSVNFNSLFGEAFFEVRQVYICKNIYRLRTNKILEFTSHRLFFVVIPHWFPISPTLN